MNPLEVLLAALAANALLLAAVAFLIKSLVGQMLAKDVERFKADLAQATTRTTEELKHQLSLIAHEHHVRFTKLHEEQAQVLRLIYQKLLDFEDASAALAVGSITSDDLLELTLRKAEDTGKELEEYIRRSRIYLPMETSRNLASMLEGVFKLLGHCSFNLIQRKLSGDSQSADAIETQSAWAAVHNYLEHEAPSLRSSIEEEFRKVLGAEPA